MSDSDSEITKKLKDASSDLLMPSESEYPFEPFVWPGVCDQLNPKKILELTGHPQDSPVEIANLSDVFSNFAQEKDWHDEEQKVNVPKYHNLVETLQANLSEIQVFRVGKKLIDVYVVGKTQSGDLAGLSTKVVET